METLNRHVAEGQPKRRTSGPGMKGGKIDLDRYGGPEEIMEALKSGELDIKDPKIRRLGGLD